MLTPLAVDPAHPFPYISGLSLNLAVLVRNPKTDKEHFARVKVPPIFSRFVPLGNQRFVPLEDVIGEHLKRLFPGMEVLSVNTFRVTRNEDLEVEEDDAENLLKALEKELLRRRFGPPVRLEVEETIDEHVLELLTSELGVTRGRGVPAPRPARPARAARHRRPRPRGPEVPQLHPGHALAAGAGRVGLAGRRVQGAAPGRRTPAPPLRLVQHVGPALHRAGCRRPARARDQADALPHLGRLTDHRCARRRGRGRQAGAGDRRDQGALRRAGQHPLGAQARARRLPRGLRAGRAQDALQAVDGRPRRARGHPALHPHRHRQLQPEDRAHVRGLRAAHHRRGDRRGRRPPVQQPQRLLAQRVVRRAAGRPRLGAQRTDRADPRARSRTTAPAGRRASGSRPTRSSTRRSSTQLYQASRAGVPDRPARPRHLRRAPGRARALRDASGCARSSAATSSTAGSCGSRTAASRSPGSARPT